MALRRKDVASPILSSSRGGTDVDVVFVVEFDFDENSKAGDDDDDDVVGVGSHPMSSSCECGAFVSSVSTNIAFSPR
jgi:hypothetical protein